MIFFCNRKAKQCLAAYPASHIQMILVGGQGWCGKLFRHYSRPTVGIKLYLSHSQKAKHHLEKIFSGIAFLHSKVWNIRSKAWNIYFKVWNICSKVWNKLFVREIKSFTTGIHKKKYQAIKKK